MEEAKRARKAETSKRPSRHLRSSAPYFYPDPRPQGGRARRAGPRQKKDIQSIQSKIRRFGIKQQNLRRERVSYLMMDVPHYIRVSQTPKVKRAVLLSRPPSPHEKQLNRLTNVPQGRNDGRPPNHTLQD